MPKKMEIIISILPAAFHNRMLFSQMQRELYEETGDDILKVEKERGNVVEKIRIPGQRIRDLGISNLILLQKVDNDTPGVTPC